MSTNVLNGTVRVSNHKRTKPMVQGACRSMTDVAMVMLATLKHHRPQLKYPKDDGRDKH